MELPEAPNYIWYMAAQTAHRGGEHEEALTFLRTYQEKERAKLEGKPSSESKPKRSRS
jgi:hypothetical protein